MVTLKELVYNYSSVCSDIELIKNGLSRTTLKPKGYRWCVV